MDRRSIDFYKKMCISVFNISPNYRITKFYNRMRVEQTVDNQTDHFSTTANNKIQPINYDNN
jgi:hypothetical protein